ncbi:FtsX-like permease family protein [Cellulomonas shaoxiangyii]|uniref:ABC transporter permease n=1 Tax=Cellulomonas shaoxiangyii TaxID=2566013 RepID=A0A4P7SJ45_9CELL|nr:ABC transporter permease [Cellulomonas shaoxiangyii]QCB93116.1 ABC transporter permease [Cellulomonas shaoxiangyii]TGY77175.1 ABC transporter permease [Cellulomonas shaoxiangyii]
MLRLTLSQMRRSLGRLAAAGVAIALGAAFVAATLIAGDVITRTGYDAVTAGYGRADLVVGVPDGTTDDQLADLRAVPGVAGADPVILGWTQVGVGPRETSERLLGTPSDPRLGTLEVVDGAAPSADDEIALSATTAERLGARVGDLVEVSWYPLQEGGSTAAPAEETAEVRLVGIVEDPAGAWSEYGGAGLATPASALRWSGLPSVEEADPVRVLVAADPGRADEVRAGLPDVLPAGATVQTRDEAAAEAVGRITGAGNVLVTVALGFAAIALLVAALVIANTFQVLVAQRARTLALLRCVGARRGQLRASVLTEAALLGVGSSVVGLLLGVGLAQAALSVLARMDLGVPLPATVAVTPAVLLLPVVVGTVVTVLAALVPARVATRVSPVAALRPVDAPSLGAGAGRLRLALSLLLTTGGVAALLGAVALAVAGTGVDEMLPLLVGVLGGATSFVGILLGAVLWLPRVVSAVGALLRRAGPSARLAAANTLRNPRRTAATSTALLIGVTLVAMMSTGAASARTSLARVMDERYPVDLLVVPADGASAVPADVVDLVAGTPGVEQVLEVATARVALDGHLVGAYVLDPDDAPAVLEDDTVVASLADGVAVVPSWTGLDGTVTAHPADDTGATSGPGAQLRVRSGGADEAYLPAAAGDRLAIDGERTLLFARIAAGAPAGQVLTSVQNGISDAEVHVTSPAASRESDERMIDTLLAVVVGLLAVAVVIALVGVANTLSLSVIERRRESATLRAIGLSRRGLRLMLAVEGMLIAGVGAALGVGLGLLYGWAGAATVFGTAGDLRLAVPWTELAIVLAVALLAGLAASVLPARSAARTPPVAALAVD